MSFWRELAPGVLVSGQVPLNALSDLAAAGVTRIINNRPDHEDPGQPTSTETEAAARAAGLDYIWAPARGMPDGQVVTAVGEALSDGASTLLYCRSGLRSAAAWGMAEVAAGRLTPEDARTAAARAGFDLSRIPL